MNRVTNGTKKENFMQNVCKEIQLLFKGSSKTVLLLVSSLFPPEAAS
jgi:hypothetical protein